MSAAVLAAAWPTVTGLPGSPPVIFADASLPHQPRITVADGLLVLTCNCQARPGKDTTAITSGPELPARLAMAAYRQWHTDHGERVQS